MTPQELIGELYDAVDNDDMYSRSYLVYAVEDLCTENDKLREIVRELYQCSRQVGCDRCGGGYRLSCSVRDRMGELGGDV